MKYKPKICIIGFGRFGRLLADILSPFGEINIISRRKIKGVKQIDYEDLDKIDWVIPSVPISATEKEFKKIAPLLKKGSLVMDVCSVKVYPCRWLKKHIPAGVEIIGTHPMFGPDSAKKGLEGLQIVLCPLRISNKRLNELKHIFRKLKLKIITTTPEDHDREAAVSLSMVHFLGRALTHINIKKQTISTLGFERLLTVNETVNNDTFELFLDMHQYNPYSKKIRKDIISSLKKLDKKIVEEGRKNE